MLSILALDDTKQSLFGERSDCLENSLHIFIRTIVQVAAEDPLRLVKVLSTGLVVDGSSLPLGKSFS